MLLDAAAQTFAHKGFHGASVEEIAEAAGFSIGALYSNFSSKEQLFLELLSQRAHDRVTAAAEIFADADANTDPTTGEPLAALSRMLVDVADKDTDFAPLQAEFWLYAVRNPDVMETLAKRMREPRDALARLVDTTRDQPVVPSETVATVVLALFQGLVRQRRIDPASVPAELFGESLRWLFTGLEANEQEARK
ncbi:TetR/AcrR family transcriptional regulator [Amycolatopsis nigrescens]|uniref:TetR/AcrR family transcriptional regulator n=1 Tax=Amycolatopsis nigrescens TaxID=381445 RepID=UPI001FE13883|nr:TetR/AcrR family transcriptional regulator [Amycolatopsis nigrescens]